MKYTGITKVLIPWFDTEGMKQRTLLTITGDIDRRTLIKGIIKFCKQNFQKTVSQSWIMKNCAIINENENSATMITKDRALGQFSPEIEAWIKRCEEAEEDETETGGHTEGQGSDTKNPEHALPDMSGLDGSVAAD